MVSFKRAFWQVYSDDFYSGLSAVHNFASKIGARKFQRARTREDRIWAAGKPNRIRTKWHMIMMPVGK